MSKKNTKSGCALFAALGLIGGGFSSVIKSGSKTTGKAIKPVPAVKPVTGGLKDGLLDLPSFLIHRDENKDLSRR